MYGSDFFPYVHFGFTQKNDVFIFWGGVGKESRHKSKYLL